MSLPTRPFCSYCGNTNDGHEHERVPGPPAPPRFFGCCGGSFVIGSRRYGHTAECPEMAAICALCGKSRREHSLDSCPGGQRPQFTPVSAQPTPPPAEPPRKVLSKEYFAWAANHLLMCSRVECAPCEAIRFIEVAPPAEDAAQRDSSSAPLTRNSERLAALLETLCSKCGGNYSEHVGDDCYDVSGKSLRTKFTPFEASAAQPKAVAPEPQPFRHAEGCNIKTGTYCNCDGPAACVCGHSASSHATSHESAPEGSCLGCACPVFRAAATPEMEARVEEMAEVLFNSDQLGVWDEEDDVRKERYRTMARSALTTLDALREGK